MVHRLHSGLAAAWESCEATRSELLAILGTVEPETWAARPVSDAWSAAEHVDHLVRSEVGTSQMARKLIRGDFKGTPPPRDTRVHDGRLDTYPYGRLPAPAVLVPARLRLDEAVAQLAAVHRRFLDELLLFDGPDANAPAAPDPATGVWFTLAGWVRLQALHEAHHLVQIRQLRGRG